MSLDLFVLQPVNSTSLEEALAVVMEERSGVPDASGELAAYARRGL